MKKVLLIYPKYDFKSEDPWDFRFPRGLAVLATVIEQEGHYAKIIDMQNLKQTYSNLETEIKTIYPDIIGINIHASPYIPEAAKISKFIKQINPDIKILVGGRGASTVREELFQWIPEIDVICLNDAIESIKILLNKENWNNLVDVPSIIFKNNNKFIKTKQGLRNTNYIPPAFHLLNIKKYRKIISEPHVETMTGCPFNCNFCGEDKNRKTTIYDIKDVLDELKFWSDNGFNTFNVVDATISLLPKRMIEFSKGIKDRKLDVYWHCNTRSDCITTEFVEGVKDNCFMIALGVESGSQKVLNNINKKTTTIIHNEAIQKLRKAEIESCAIIILGLPEENESDITSTYNFLKTSKPDYILQYIFKPIPGSTYYEKMGRKYIQTIDDWKKFDHNAPLLSEDPEKTIFINDWYNKFRREFNSLSPPIRGTQNGHKEKSKKNNKETYC